MGGHTNDQISSVAVDPFGNAYVTGVTRDADCPVTPGAFQSANRATATENQTGFVSNVNAGGTALVYSTYLGGSNEDFPAGIAVDTSGAAYITGATESTDFPTTAGAFQTNTSAPDATGFVTKIDPAGTELVYSTYLSGSLSDVPNAIAVDPPGNAYVTGVTSSSDFPLTSRAFQTSSNGGLEWVFVTKLNSSGSALIYSTFLSGGPAAAANFPENRGIGIAVDASGHAFVGGSTDTPNFPTTPGAFQTTNLTATISGDYGSFVTELNDTGTSLLYSTYLSGSGIWDLLDGNDPFYEIISGITLGGAGNPYVAGVTYSNDFPVTPGAFETTPGAAGNTFLTKFDVRLMKQLPVPTVNVTADANPQTAGVPVVFTAQVVPASAGSTPTGAGGFSIDEGVNAATLGGYPAIGHPQTVNLDGSGTATFSTTALGDGAGQTRLPSITLAMRTTRQAAALRRNHNARFGQPSSGYICNSECSPSSVWFRRYIWHQRERSIRKGCA